LHLLKEIPIIRYLLILVCGILMSYQAGGQYVNIFIFCSLIAVIGFIFFQAIPYLYRNFTIRWLPGFFACVFLFSVGWVLTGLKMPSRLFEDSMVSATGRVVTMAASRGDWSRIIFDPDMVSPDSVKVKSDDLWMLMVRQGQAPFSIEPGVSVSIGGLLQKHQGPSNPGAFDYGSYLFRNGISGQMFLTSEQIQVVNPKPDWSLALLSARIRDHCVTVFSESGLAGSRLALLSALVLGERKGIDRALNDQFIRSGAIHILAVSGLHVGIVFLFLNFVRSFFCKPTNPIGVGIIVFLLFFYAFITGFSPSVTRAVVMFSLIQTGKTFARHINMYNMLCVSAFIILLWNPLFLYHAGFWLSHLAVAGIVAFYPMINGLLSFKFLIFKWMWSILSVSLAAQITTVPMSLWMFGAFPSYFLLTNLLILPIATPILIVGLLLIMVSWMPVLPSMLGAFLNDLVGFMEGAVGTIESLPGAYLTHIWVSGPLAFLLFLLLFFWYQNHQNPRPASMLKILALAVGVTLVLDVQWTFKRMGHQCVVYDTGKEFLVQFIQNGRCISIASPGLTQTQRIYAAGCHEKKHVLGRDTLFILNEEAAQQPPEVYRVTCGGQTYCVVSGGKGVLSGCLTGPADVLVIAGSPDLELAGLIEKLECHTLVFASNCAPWKIRKWNSSLKDKDLRVYAVATSGAFIQRN
jgi:competence protein ComEC